jgi:hypothetical protein
MEFTPFSQGYNYDPNVLIEDFPDYLLPHVKDWIIAVMSTAGIQAGNHLDHEFKKELEFLIRQVLPTQTVSFIAWWESQPQGICNLLTLMLQNYANQQQVVTLVELLRKNSSAYTAEPIAQKDEKELGGYILVKRVPDTVRQQVEVAARSDDLIRKAWIECYKMHPNYTEAVRLANDFIEGILRDKFWSERKIPYTVGQAINKIQANDSNFHFKGEKFVADKSKVISLLQGIANIRGIHTKGQGREPTADEAEFIVQTCIYLSTLFEPVQPLNSDSSSV